MTRPGGAADPAPGGGPFSVAEERPGAGSGTDEAERAVEQALALVARRSSGAPHAADRPVGTRPSRGRGTVSWPEARALAVRAGRAVGARTVRVPLDRSLGHVLAEPLTALTDLPSFDTSAMDGWAVSGPGPWRLDEATGAEDGPAGTGTGNRTRNGTRNANANGNGNGAEGAGGGAGILAGQGTVPELPDGAAVRIATGARIPPGADAVIRSEHAHADGATGLLHAERQVLPGQDIRPRGQECRSGDLLMPPGALMTPAVLGLAAAAGYDTLVVVARPRVDVLVLGDELLTDGLPHDGLIRDALGPMIGPWLRTLGAEVSAPQRLGDDAAALRHALATSEADLVVTTGGTAAGPVDHVHSVLAEAGAELLVDGAEVRPGHPMLLARLGGKDTADRAGGGYLVGLPGNPLAAVSGLLTLAEPLLRGLAGQAPEPSYWTVAGEDVQGHPHDTRLVPVVTRVGTAASRGPGATAGAGGAGGAGALRPPGNAPDTGGGAECVVPLRYNGPAMLRGIAAADGLAVVPPGGVRSGTEVEILDLRWASAMPWTEGCFT
ncbi:molybdopterin molybdotransferase MoeA [Streptomyces sp. NPDC092952]|uniref:molybdopterin molybdotransferase MoeA n=1 Tax=Streptomyces sp. NPDC092952 TaxID=3366018 RepID=UPI0038085343